MANLDLESAVTRYAQHSRAPGTRASYLQKMVPFRAFCAERGVKAVPADPETVRLYLAKLAEDGLSVSTVNQFLSAISEKEIIRIVNVDDHGQVSLLVATWRDEQEKLRASLSVDYDSDEGDP